MNREQATRQIERIVAAIEAGRFPAVVTEFYVFGSYARGALEPADLDLILIHEAAPPELLARLKDEIEKKYGKHRINWPLGALPERKFENMMCRVMRKPGEKMDILLGTSIQQVLDMGDNIANSNRVTIWSASDRDWRRKLDGIAPDPNAGTFERGHFAKLRRFRGDLRTMNNVMEAIRQGYLTLTRINAEAVTPSLNAVYQHWYDWWVQCKVMGKDSMKLLQHGMWWMQQQRGQVRHRPNPSFHDGIMCSEDGKYAVFFGMPSLYAVHDLWDDRRRYSAICMIPHFKRGQPNEMFVFERGGKKSQKGFEEIMRSV